MVGALNKRESRVGSPFLVCSAMCKLLAEGEGRGEWGVGRGGSGEDGVGAGDAFHGVGFGVVDGLAELVEGDGDGLRFSGGELDAVEADEALVVFAGGLGNLGVDFSDFGSGARAGVLDGEGGGGSVTVHGEIGVGVGGVGESEAEGELRREVPLLKPLVAD